jgi:intracellular septation protein A
VAQLSTLGCAAARFDFMDRIELTKIAIAALMGAAAKELIAWIFRHSPAVARVLTKAAIKILKRHWRILFILYDLFFVFMGIYYLILFCRDTTPATKQFVVITAGMFWVIGNSALKYRAHCRNYVLDIQKSAA